ncbi:acyl-CoA dehydrogenase [Mesorhizobium huakuii]|uniref:Acyl-CoA dehydrogenase n=1 Tax=Mesorhizobium huakuii TaxID=28104 RepID=A0ABZ0VU40_9HYPH|nr:acyl-CoA dehydrogenase [Mesorhizobium huakuii]WQC00786.1 acyl-CoA dehydrogenase [Mesorhizobium huakuii]
MTFQAPVKDLMFNIAHIAPWSGDAMGDLEIASAVLEEFGRFCAEEIAPLNAAGDRIGSHWEGGHVQTPPGFREAYAKFMDMGWQGLRHPSEFGGHDMPRAVAAAATEIINAANMSFALCPLLTDGAIEALLRFGSPEIQQTYLHKLVSGKWTGTMNLTEPQAGSDLALIRTRAERQANGTYQISGTKIFITYGEHDLAENIIHLVLARTPGAPDGVKGISLFLVPKLLVGESGEPGAQNSLRCQSIEHKLGVRASPTCMLEFEGATGFLIGRENAGLEIMFTMMNAARFAVGVQGVAIAERAYQMALSYAKTRMQGRPVDGSAFEAVPIIRHPDVRRMLAHMRATTEGGRALAAAAAGWQDRAQFAATPELKAEALAIGEFLVPLVKGFCTEMSLQTASTGVQIFGGMGFIEETGVAQYYRDARILPIYEGTTAIQANDLLGRKTLRDGGSTARRLAAMIAQTETALRQGSPVAQEIAAQLSCARQAFETVVAHLVAVKPADLNAAYAGAVPYLMLAGNLVAGWQLARSVLVAEAELEDGQDPDFMTAKISTARFYAQHILGDTDLQRARVMDGAASLLDIEF